MDQNLPRCLSFLYLTLFPSFFFFFGYPVTSLSSDQMSCGDYSNSVLRGSNSWWSSWCFPQIKLIYLVLHCPALGGSSGTPQEETWSSFYKFSVPTGSVNTITITGPSYVVENQEVTLTCHSEGTDVSYYWLKGNQSIQAAEGVFLENNKLTLNPTTRDDAANYTCYGNNSFSSNSSEPHWLEVFCKSSQTAPDQQPITGDPCCRPSP